MAVRHRTGVLLPVNGGPATSPTSSYRPTAVPPYRRTAGFTLIEVMVSLALTGMAVLLAHRIFAACIGGAAAVIEARDTLDREQNAGRLLGPVVLSIDVGGGAGSFEGRADAAGFDAWIQTPDGWFERERVTLERRGSQLVVLRSRSGPVVLADSLVDLRLDYLLGYGESATWVTGWSSPVSPPLAIRLRRSRQVGREIRSDTTLFPIKPRG